MRDGKIFTAALLTAKSVKFTYREKFQVYGSCTVVIVHCKYLYCMLYVLYCKLYLYCMLHVLALLYVLVLYDVTLCTVAWKNSFAECCSLN